MIQSTQLDELLAGIEPWLALLDAQARSSHLPQMAAEGPELLEALYAEFRNATQEYAQLANLSGLRGLANVTMLLLRGMVDSKRQALNEDEVMQITLWLSGVQSYLQAELAEPQCLIEDLQALSWVPKLAPAAIGVLTQRLNEPLPVLAQLNEARHESLRLDQTESSLLASTSSDLPISEETFNLSPSIASAIEDETFASGGFLGDESESSVLGQVSPIRRHDRQVLKQPQAIAQQVSPIRHESIGSGEDLGASDFSFAATFSADTLSSGFDISEAPENAELASHTLDAGLAFASSDAPFETDGDSTIWIAPEEFQLVSETVQARLLPELVSLASSVGEAARAHYAEVQYQIELLGNTFAVLNLMQSQAMSQKLLLALPSTEVLEADQADQLPGMSTALLQWGLVMVEFCARPGDVSAQAAVVEIVADSGWLAALDASEADALRAEFARITIGMDPSLKAARKSIITEDDVRLVPADDVMPQVLQGMLLELPENAHALSASIESFVQTGDPEAIDNARRVAHTLKGDSNTVGIKGIANLTHALEDIFIELAKNPGVPKKGFAELLTNAADCVSAMADHVLGRSEAPSDAIEVMQQLQNIANDLVDGTASIDSDIASSASQPADQDATLAERLAEIAQAQSTAPPMAPAAAPSMDVPMLQVPADVLDQLLEFSSEALVLLRQIENQIRAVDDGQNEMERQRQDAANLLGELDRSVNLRGNSLQSSRTRGEAIDPLELDSYNELYMVTRRLMEVSADEYASRNSIERATRRLIDLAAEQEKVQLELQNQIMKTRQVSVKEFVGRFQRAVRQTSKMLDKDVNFAVAGQDTQIDRVQMESLIDPLMHALRNSVDHGIEVQSLRMTRKKSVAGNVQLSFERDGRQIAVRLTDDGAGLNYERIRAKAIAKGFIGESDQLNEDDLAQLILLPGFSTKEEVTQVSGRGIGLDVVFQRIQDLRGTLAIRSKPGAGMTMDIRLPASMTSLYTALAPVKKGWAAIASDSVESFELVSPHDCVMQNERIMMSWNEELIPLVDLEAFICGYRSENLLPTQVGVGVLVRQSSGELQMGFLPSVSEMRTVIVKDFGPYMRSFAGVRGGTILGDGSVAPVVDARELMRSTAYQPWSGRDESYRESLSKQVRLRALVADDSLSVRRALEQLLTDIGFEVYSARDGLEALSLIKDKEPDILLLDLEMPRMNGLEVSSFVRKSETMSEVPIIMITSRTSEKHQKMAKDAGVTHLLSKPFVEDQLIDLVQRTVGFKSAHA